MTIAVRQQQEQQHLTSTQTSYEDPLSSQTTSAAALDEDFSLEKMTEAMLK